MATDIIARGMAANAKKSVTALGNKIESEKWIGTKAEWEAVDKSTIKDGTIVYITDDETVILYDKAEMEKIAAQVAEDRKTAETAAQTAQSIADSLPDDYVTAVGKIAENTAEIGRVKLSDKELQRRVNALYDMENGITHQFETDTDTAYAKTVPTGAKLMSVKNIGGRSIVWNQLISQIVEKTSNGIATTKIDSKSLHISGTSSAVCFIPISPVQTGISNHKYLFHSHASDTTALSSGTGFYNDNGGNRWHEYGKGIIFTMDGNGTIAIAFRVNSNITVDFSITPQIFDLTAMFGAENEPTSVEEFEKMFPATYYPYNAGEIVSAGVTNVAVGDTAYQIPDTIRNLPGYGWSAGTARNYVDYENKIYVQCVGSVDLGTLDWTSRLSTVDNSIYVFISNDLNVNNRGNNGLCSHYDFVTSGIDATIVKKDKFFYYNPLNIAFIDKSYTDAAAFKQAMQGVILYYELANPIVTDISTLIPDDFLRNIEVEAGGSVTFKNSNDNYHIPVPNEEEYIVKLSEVGGTT